MENKVEKIVIPGSILWTEKVDPNIFEGWPSAAIMSYYEHHGFKLTNDGGGDFTWIMINETGERVIMRTEIVVDEPSGNEIALWVCLK